MPGRGAVHVNAVVGPVATSVENDCTRGNCVGGVPDVVVSTMGHVTAPWALEWSGLGVEVAVVPRPPPN